MTVNLYNSTHGLVNTTNSTTSPLYGNFTGLAEGLYYINATVNDTASNENYSLSRVFVIDTVVPSTISYAGFTPANNSNLSYSSIYVNVSATDASIDIIEISLLNSTFDILNTTNATRGSGSAFFNHTTLPDGVYYVNATVNDTANNINRSWNRKFLIDTTAPTITFACTPNSVSAGGTITCTCTGTDAVTGILTATFNATPSTSTAGTYNEYCILTDYTGNSVTSAVVTNTVIGGGGSASSGGSSSGAPTSTNTNVWSKVVAGEEIIASNLDSNSGIKEIKITPSAEATNVKVIVKGYITKPLGVSVEKTGLVYKYIEIDAPSLVGKIKEAKIQINVEKSFSDKNQVALYKFDETAGVWNELETVFVKEVGESYYYDVLVNSFSYFAISEKSKVDSGDDDLGIVDKVGDILSGESGGISLWIWIIVAVIVIIIIGLIVIKKKE